MKNTFCSVTLGAAALAVAALIVPSAPASAKATHLGKKHTKMHAKTSAKTHAKLPPASKSLTPAPGNTGPARTGTGPSPTTGRVTGTVPNAVGDAGQVSPPSAPAGGGVSQ